MTPAQIQRLRAVCQKLRQLALGLGPDGAKLNELAEECESITKLVDGSTERDRSDRRR